MDSKLPFEALETRHLLFRDYCNVRDQVKKRMKRTAIELTKEQSRRVLHAARQHHHKRETPKSMKWYEGYKANVQKYLMAICVDSWPKLKGL